MENIYLLNFEDCFISSEDMKNIRNKEFYSSKNQEFSHHLFPVCNLQALKNFKAFIKNNPEAVFCFSEMHHMFQNDPSWWFELFSRHGLRVNIYSDPVLYYLPQIRSKLSILDETFFKKQENLVKIIDSSFVEIKKIAHVQNKAYQEYLQKYDMYIGQNRRKSNIPINEYTCYETEQLLFSKISSLCVDISRNQTIDEFVLGSLISNH